MSAPLDMPHWFITNINENFTKDRIEIVKLLQEENELQEIAKVVGQDVLSDTKKLVLETCRAIRLGFLQQSAVSENDTYVPIEKQYKMMSTILKLYTISLKLVEKGVPLSRIKGIGLFDEYIKLKFNVRNDQLFKFDEFNNKVVKELKQVNEEYKEHC